MSIDIDTLLQQEDLTLAPQDGRFDTAAIARRIGTLGAAWNDPVRPEVWLVFASDEARQDFARAFDPGAPRKYPYVLLFEVRPATLYANLFAGEEVFAQASALLAWLTSTWACKVVEHGSQEPPASEEGLNG